MCLYALFNDASNYAFRFLAGYSMVTGALFGIMVCDFWLVRRRQLSVASLYPFGFSSSASSTAKRPSPFACTAVTTGVRSSPCWSASRFPHPVGS